MKRSIEQRYAEAARYEASITESMIVALRAEAGKAGDLEQVAVCDRALTDDVEAIVECRRVIDDARAQGEVTS